MGLQLQSVEAIYRSIVDSCRSKRKHLGFTQQKLAERTGLSQRTIIKFESYETANLQSLMKIFLALGELGRWNDLVIPILNSPKEQFLKDQRGKN